MTEPARDTAPCEKRPSTSGYGAYWCKTHYSPMLAHLDICASAATKQRDDWTRGVVADA